MFQRSSLVLACVLGILAGCGSSKIEPGPYPVGSLRDQLALPGTPMETDFRPASGWQAGQDSRGIGKAVLQFEQENPGKVVQRCEVYWADRKASSPFASGVYWDYLFFDRDNRLLGSWRRLMD